MLLDGWGFAMLSVLRGTTSILVAWVPHTEGFISRKHNWTLGLLIFSVIPMLRYISKDLQFFLGSTYQWDRSLFLSIVTNLSDWAKLLEVAEGISRLANRLRLTRDHGLCPPERQVLDLASGGEDFWENFRRLGWYQTKRHTKIAAKSADIPDLWGKIRCHEFGVFSFFKNSLFLYIFFWEIYHSTAICWGIGGDGRNIWRVPSMESAGHICKCLLIVRGC